MEFIYKPCDGNSLIRVQGNRRRRRTKTSITVQDSLKILQVVDVLHVLQDGPRLGAQVTFL